MKTFRNLNARTAAEASALLGTNPNSMVVGGGSDLLGMIKERIVTPDVLVNLKSASGMNLISRGVSDGTDRKGRAVEDFFISIGGLVTLDTISHDPAIQQSLQVLAEAAGQVGTPQIRNVGTLAGNLMQRPWCWYYRNNFPCYNGGNQCFSVVGENEFHAIFGGGPSYIVHPSDTAVALSALDTVFRIAKPSGEGFEILASDFFQLPKVNPAKENSLGANEVLERVNVSVPPKGTRSTYTKILDREAWTHAVVSVAVVMEMDGDVCKDARVVLGGVAPIPWRVPAVEAMLKGQKITEALASQAGEKTVEGARSLAKNGYKIPLTRSIVKDTIFKLGTSA